MTNGSYSQRVETFSFQFYIFSPLLICGGNTTIAWTLRKDKDFERNLQPANQFYLLLFLSLVSLVRHNGGTGWKYRKYPDITGLHLFFLSNDRKNIN